MSMVTVETYADLPRKLGHHACIVLMLMQAADMMGVYPVTERWVFDRSPGYGINSITHAVRKLESFEIQLVKRVTGGWVINKEAAFQLPLGYALTDENHSESDSGATTTTLNKRVEVYSSSSSSLTGLVDENHSESDFQNKINANLAACKASGIGQPKASYLAALEHVTPDYIHAHVESEGPGNLGLAIRKIENNEQPIIWQRASEQPQQTGLWAEYLESDESPKSICTWQDYLGTYKDNWGQLQKRFSRFCGEPIPAGERYCTKHKKADDDPERTGTYSGSVRDD